MKRYVSKPVECEAVQVTADNLNEIKEWAGRDNFPGGVLVNARIGDWVTRLVGEQSVSFLPNDFFLKRYEPGKEQ